MAYSCENHPKFDLAQIGADLKPGCSRRLPPHRVSWTATKKVEVGYARVTFSYWAQGTVTRHGDEIRVALSEGVTETRLGYSTGKNVMFRRSKHVLRLAEAPSAIGGTREWLVCRCCERKVRALYYKPQNGFQCRHCNRLKHQSTLTYKTQRRMKREAELHRMLGGSGNHREQAPLDRPRYMRRKRHEALRFEYVTTAIELDVIRRRREQRRIRAVLRSHPGLLARLGYHA